MLKRIEERKKQRAVEKNKSKLQEESNNLEEPKKKKRKHLQNAKEVNDSHIEDKNETSEEISEQTTEVGKASTKRKRKKSSKIQDHSTTVQETEELGEVEDNLANKKKNDDQSITEEKKTQQNNFTVLGVKPQKKKREVKRVLPDWLVHPEIVSVDLNSGPSLEEFNSILDAKLIEILKANGITKLFPVQSNVMKWLHKCNMDRKLGWWVRDTCVSAPTGSGKCLIRKINIDDN